MFPHGVHLPNPETAADQKGVKQALLRIPQQIAEGSRHHR
jgi:hypothetical protein